MTRARPAETTDPDPGESPEGGVVGGPGPLEGSSGTRPNSGLTDHDLVRAAQRGEVWGFEELVRRHQGRALRVARNMVPTDDDAQDLVQEAYMRVFKSLERFDFAHEFTTWLFRIVTNLAIDHLRRRRPSLRAGSAAGDEDDEGEPGLELLDPDMPDPSSAMERSETAAAVRACIDGLAPHFQAVLVLRELEGLPCTEIAKIVGATHVTVRWRLHRGRKLFQEEWERRERGRLTRPAEGGIAANTQGEPDVCSSAEETE